MWAGNEWGLAIIKRWKFIRTGKEWENENEVGMENQCGMEMN